MKKFSITQEIHPARVADLLCSAFEGGSNYWYSKMKPQSFAAGLNFGDFGAGGKAQWKDEGGKEDYQHWSTLVPLTEGCSITFQVSEDSPYAEDGPREGLPVTVKKGVCTVVLDWAAIQKGLEIFPTKAPKQYADWLAENDDAETGDVFLQLCCFGEVIFG